MTIFESIIRNNLPEVKNFIESGTYSALDLEPSEFVGQHGIICDRENPKTALQVAVSLNRKEIADYLRGSLTPKGE